MCGIAGSIDSNNMIDERIIPCLRHRGPDGQGHFAEGEVILYHSRLAIQDVQEGKQPMYLDDDLVTVYNGEIYNHLELRKKYGLQCHTRSDTETFLHLYKKIGIGFVHELDGMFAIALYDKRVQKVYLIRDRAGEKPLYYYHYNHTLSFASELNVLKGSLNLQIHHEYFYEYLRMGSFFREHTPYKNVNELPAGHWMEIDVPSKTYKVQRWWDIKPFYQEPSNLSLDGALQQADVILRKAVQQRMLSSDLEVGCFLSGGIDSSLVATTATDFNHQLKTFTVAFPGAYNEAPLAKLVADKIGSHHTEININFNDLLQNVEGIIANYGEPFMDASAIPTWYVSREARKHVTVILNGDGADELFGGYRKYVPLASYDFFNASAFIKGAATLFNSILPVSHNKKSVYNYLYRLTALAKNNPLNIYLAAGADIFEGFTRKSFIEQQPEVYNEISGFIQKRISGVSGGLNKLILLDFDLNLMNQMLVKMDIGSMAHALEGRSPFLCKDFLEWVPALPEKFKVKGRTTKFLLRQLSKKHIPQELVNQPKRGFEVPLKSWVDGDLKEMMGEYLFSSNTLHCNFIQPLFLQQIWDRKLRMGDEKRAKILWNVFVMEVWYRKCYLP